MIAGFEIPSTGRILIGNTDITDLPPYKRQVNTIFQNYSLFPHMTVFDNVAFGLRIWKSPKMRLQKEFVKCFLWLKWKTGKQISRTDFRWTKTACSYCSRFNQPAQSFTFG